MIARNNIFTEYSINNVKSTWEIKNNNYAIVENGGDTFVKIIKRKYT